MVLDELNSEFPIRECVNPENKSDCQYIVNEAGEPRTVLNGLSIILAMISMFIVIPITMHIMYVITFYFNYL